jgi:hypothetical protein
VRSHVAHPAEALVHAPVTMDRKTHRSLCPSCHHRTRPRGRAIIATNGDEISIHTTEEMEMYEPLHHQEFAHTHVCDVNLLERVGLDEELPTILQTIGWGKLYDEPRLGSHLLTLEFLMTFETIEKNRKSFVKFCMF